MKETKTATPIHRRATTLTVTLGLLLLTALVSAAMSRAVSLHAVSSSAAWQKDQSAGDAQEKSITGQWAIEALEDGNSLSTALTRTSQAGGRDTRYFKLAVGELTGLSREQILSGSGERVRFQLRRPAGTFDFEGTFAAGKGSGSFVFTADENFIATMRHGGYGEALKRNLFGFAIGNFRGDVAAEFTALGVETPSPEQMELLSTQAVSASFIRELKALGYEPRSIDQLINLRRHGASAEYVRALMAAGFERPTLEQLISLRIHGVSLRFIEELRMLGFEPRSVEQLISLRVHGASVEFIKTVAALGYERPTLDQLIAMRIHGVTPRFIEELKSLGYERVPLDKLISMKIHGVTLDFIRELRSQGYTDVPLDRLFDVRMFKMPVEFLKHLPRAGEGDRSVEWLIKFYGRSSSRVWMFLRGGADGGGHSSEVATEQLHGLTEKDVFSDGASVRFQLARGEQSLDCVGWFKGGFGAGTCVAAKR
jgi:hypothetical protein